ncbi:flagellar protein FlaG [Lamprobacter modestohalophilus]|uniref:flagellar protein FlaG n=1 Tax=Lamprobacter modestohalophilus TaxID=1064514 RepID=UPI002ADEFC69|nr:flagellar protein FlaG [Lamprobacter modestohalophilus]MEA1053200.1 flagellar protein FlaG [Lamprobacter modestohalophilus]
MSSAITDISQTAPNTAPVNQLNPRQRLEGLLQQQLTAGSALVRALEQSNQAPSRSEVEEPLRRVNAVLSGDGVPFERSDPPGGRLVTKLVDQESGDLIRQVPAEEVLRMAERLEDLMTSRGGLVSEKV